MKRELGVKIDSRSSNPKVTSLSLNPVQNNSDLFMRLSNMRAKSPALYSSKLIISSRLIICEK